MDVIPLESDDDDDDDDFAIEIVGSSEEDSSGPDDVPLPAGPELRRSKRRKWSPSRPYTSDAPSIGGSRSRQSSPVRPASTTSLSTFKPNPNQNLWRLSIEQIQSLPHPPAHSSAGILISLEDGKTLTFAGTYTLTILRGSISLCGVTLAASKRSHPVFAPLCSPLPTLEAHSPEEEGDDGPLLSFLQENFNISITRGSTVILVQSLPSGVEGLGKVVKSLENAFLIPEHDSLQLDGVSMVVNPSRNIQPYIVPTSWERELQTAGLTLQTSLLEVSANSSDIFLVKGPKKTGKSTFARLVLNLLLTRYRRVAFIECDIGQSEFTPAGMVALNVIEQPVFGPPFTHPTLPQFAHYIGSSTPRSSPSHYLSSIQALIEAYKLEIRNPAPEDTTDPTEVDDDRISDIIPLVVNTMGWNKGLGADLNTKIEQTIIPTHIFEFEVPNETTRPRRRSNSFSGRAKSTERVEDRIEGVTYHMVEAVDTSVLGTSYNAADHRSMALMSYFYASFPSLDDLSSSSSFASTKVPLYRQHTAERWSTDLPLLAQYPYVVDPTTALDRTVLTGAGSEDVVSNEVGRVLNGALVGIVKCSPEVLDLGTDGEVITTQDDDHIIAKSLKYTQRAFIPDPMTSNCVGIALIRSLVVKTNSDGGSNNNVELQILTPLPPSLLSRYHFPNQISVTQPDESVILVKGELELPIWGFLDWREESEGKVVVEGEELPYLRWEKGTGVGGVRKAVRRNLLRRGQM
ncbi:hypothetical protein BDN72DRAFT_771728 [Pluteus cervinus]|uniref:Uncharacterized protein n=1 Tax=Pluteus cervinus TaxID=181527 RepID=A0ACD3ALM4_9AGAR|nr:hypothetical protein BDN72DRAFT_771728 [Pluteus cervinus]